MEPQILAEKVLTDNVSSVSVSRDDVRGWVVQEQSRCRRRGNRIILAIAVCFSVLASGLWFSVDHQMRGIRQLIDRQPAKAVTKLTEITQELCDAPPADYFLQQLSRRKPNNQSLITSVAAR